MSKQDSSRSIKIQELIMRPKQDCLRKFLLVQGLKPGIGIFQSRNPGIGKEVRDCNPQSLLSVPVKYLHSAVLVIFLLCNRLYSITVHSRNIPHLTLDVRCSITINDTLCIQASSGLAYLCMFIFLCVCVCVFELCLFLITGLYSV